MLWPLPGLLFSLYMSPGPAAGREGAHFQMKILFPHEKAAAAIAAALARFS